MERREAPLKNAKRSGSHSNCSRERDLTVSVLMSWSIGTRYSLSQLIWSSRPALRFLKNSALKCAAVRSRRPASTSPLESVETMSKNQLLKSSGTPTIVPLKTLAGKPDSLD